MKSFFRRSISIFLIPFLCSFFSLSMGNLKNAEDKQRAQLKTFGNRLAKKQSLKLLLIANLRIVEVLKPGFFLSLTSNQKQDLEDSRSLAITLSSEFWNEVTTNPVYQNFLHIFVRETPETDSSLKIDRIAFKLAYWDENVDRPLKPYLAQVILKEGKLYYYYANPKTQALEEPIIETLEEAKSKVSSSGTS